MKHREISYRQQSHYRRFQNGQRELRSVLPLTSIDVKAQAVKVDSERTAQLGNRLRYLYSVIVNVARLAITC